MRKNILIISVIGLALAGCFGGHTSPKSRFYGLYAPSVTQTRGPVKPTNVVIESVTVPQSVARPQMVVRQPDSTEITVAEFDRWIEGLDNALPVIISENMNAYAKNISARPSHIGTRRAAKYTVSIEFVRFDTISNGDIVLAAWWMVTDEHGDVLVQKKNTFTTETPMKSATPDYDEIVAAQSRLVAKLSYRIADAIAELK